MPAQGIKAPRQIHQRRVASWERTCAMAWVSWFTFACLPLARILIPPAASLIQPPGHFPRCPGGTSKGTPLLVTARKRT